MCRWLPAIAALTFVSSAALAEQLVPATVSVCFTPAERCGAKIAAAIDTAQTEIRFQAYGFTSPAILEALERAARRGVDVAGILDKSNLRRNASNTSTGAAFIARAGVPLWIDRPSGIAHEKVVVIDRELTIGGSENFTKAGDTRNVENVTFIRSPDIAGAFLANWTSRQAVSVAYQQPDSADGQ